MPRPKLIEKRERVPLTNPTWTKVTYTPYMRELQAFNKAQGKTLEGQKDYFEYLAETYDEKVSDIEQISESLDVKGSEDFNALLSELESRESMILNR